MSLVPFSGLAICKAFALLLGIVTMATAIPSRPSWFYKFYYEAGSSVEIGFWKEHVFFIAAIIGLSYAVISYLGHLAQWIRTSPAFMILDSGFSLLVGVILTLSSTLVIQSVVSRYLDLTHRCDDYNSFCEGAPAGGGNVTATAAAANPAGRKFFWRPDEGETVVNCVYDNRDCMKQCYCVARATVSLGLTLASAGIAFINGITFYVLYSYQRVQVQDAREIATKQGEGGKAAFKPFAMFNCNPGKHFASWPPINGEKTAALLLGLVVVTLALLTRPNYLYKQIVGSALDDTSYLLQDLYLYTTITCTSYAVVSLAFSTFVRSRVMRRGGGFASYYDIMTVDAWIFLLLGLGMLLSSAAYIQSVISRYYQLQDVCDSCRNVPEEDVGRTPSTARLLYVGSNRLAELVVEIRGQEEAILECGLGAANCQDACHCQARVVLKYYLTIFAGAVGIVEYVLLVVVGLLGLRRAGDTAVEGTDNVDRRQRHVGKESHFHGEANLQTQAAATAGNNSRASI